MSIAVRKSSLSVISVVSNNGDHLVDFLTGLTHSVEILEKAHGEIDVVIVDNGSRDRSAAIVSENLGLLRRSRLVRLPWPCGMRTAVGAGISEAVGERIVVLRCDQPVNSSYVLGVAALLESADAVLSAPPASAADARRGAAEFVAFRASVAEDLILCCRPAGLAYDLGTRMVSDAMNLRIAHLPLAADDEPKPRSTRSRDVRVRRRWHGVGHLLRAYRRRSRLAGSGEPARVRLRPLADAEAAVVLQAASVPVQPAAPDVTPAATIDLTGTDQNALIALTAPREQPGAVM
jgi:glycosyltransferase involved in cell wall biosynthesis